MAWLEHRGGEQNRPLSSHDQRIQYLLPKEEQRRATMAIESPAPAAPTPTWYETTQLSLPRLVPSTSSAVLRSALFTTCCLLRSFQNLVLGFDQRSVDVEKLLLICWCACVFCWSFQIVCVAGCELECWSGKCEWCIELRSECDAEAYNDVV